MGILNITPDSFYDGGRYTGKDAVLKRAGELIRDGADILDVGAASTKPGSELMPAEREIERLKEALPALRNQFPDVLLSVDTYNSATARYAASEGADIINDISGGTFDEQMIPTVGELKLPYILMHIQGTPETMQDKPQYEDVFQEVSYFFSRQLALCAQHKVHDVILDIGLGFGKTLEHNYDLLTALPDFKKIFDRPFLVGGSRKSMINKLLKIKPEDALNGTTVINTLALQNGATILRVHDAWEASEAQKIVTFSQNIRACRS